VAGGAYADVPAAQAKMTGTKPRVFEPKAEAVKTYRQLYEIYQMLHDAFGTRQWQSSLYEVMKQLIRIREQSRRS